MDQGFIHKDCHKIDPQNNGPRYPISAGHIFLHLQQYKKGCAERERLSLCSAQPAVLLKKPAATYSPVGGYLLSRLADSTIGAIGLNCSVRNGKRWNPDAITT